MEFPNSWKTSILLLLMIVELIALQLSAVVFSVTLANLLGSNLTSSIDALFNTVASCTTAIGSFRVFVLHIRATRACDSRALEIAWNQERGLFVDAKSGCSPSLYFCYVWANCKNDEKLEERMQLRRGQVPANQSPSCNWGCPGLLVYLTTGAETHAS